MLFFFFFFFFAFNDDYYFFLKKKLNRKEGGEGKARPVKILASRRCRNRVLRARVKARKRVSIVRRDR